MNTCLIIHGAYGTPDENWFPWLRSKLAEKTVFVPAFPTPDGQNLENWLKIALASLRDIPPEETVLIGHSIGAALALRMAEKTQKPFRAIFAVSPFARDLGLPDFDSLNASFIHPEFDWDAVARGAEHISCLAGDNDPYVPLALPEEIAAHVGAKLTVVPKGGHLNAAAGFTEFPLLLDQLKKL
ncbi:MAG: alpha/beta fold hydrolase [Alphaproteobacteria bacterium]|nr:alpha/beta fold hydrolase [Alphaproteobacteria bacterium]